MDANFVEERPPLTPESLPRLVCLRFASCLPHIDEIRLMVVKETGTLHASHMYERDRQ
jgi:hypothetical protein